jgi:amidase
VFFETHQFLICAVNQVAPFDATLDWPHEIAGVKMEHYAAWMKSAYWISTTLCPAISVPAGFTPDGLPVGVQIIGRGGDDAGVLRIAYAFEQAVGVSRRRPPLGEVGRVGRVGRVGQVGRSGRAGGSDGSGGRAGEV